MNLLLFLGIFVFGGAGAFCRFALDSAIKKRWRKQTPIGTFAINVLGSFCLGIITGLTATALVAAWGAQVAGASSLMLGTGFLGGFTTFSTALVEATNQLRSKNWRGATLLLLIQPAVAFLAALLGLLMTQ